MPTHMISQSNCEVVDGPRAGSGVEVRSIYRALSPSNSRASCHHGVIEMSILVNMLSSNGLARSSWAPATPVGMLLSQPSCWVVATESRLLCGRRQHVADEFPALGAATGHTSAGQEDFTPVHYESAARRRVLHGRCSKAGSRRASGSARRPRDGTGTGAADPG